MKKLENEAPRDPNYYDLAYGHLGNGITVFDRSRKEYGDYMKVAHISDDGTKISWYKKTLPSKYKQEIEKEAMMLRKKLAVENLTAESKIRRMVREELQVMHDLRLNKFKNR